MVGALQIQSIMPAGDMIEIIITAALP